MWLREKPSNLQSRALEEPAALNAAHPRAGEATKKGDSKKPPKYHLSL